MASALRLTHLVVVDRFSRENTTDHHILVACAVLCVRVCMCVLINATFAHSSEKLLLAATDESKQCNPFHQLTSWTKPLEHSGGLHLLRSLSPSFVTRPQHTCEEALKSCPAGCRGVIFAGTEAVRAVISLNAFCEKVSLPVSDAHQAACCEDSEASR